MKRWIVIVAAVVIVIAASLAFLWTGDGGTGGTGPSQPGLDMANYPEFFLEGGKFNALFVTDENAPESDITAADIIASGLDVDHYAGISYNNLESISAQNAIFVGTCDTEPHNKFVNIFVDCLSLDSGKATIKLTEMDGHYILFVIGSDANSTLAAAEVLMDWKNRGLRGDEIEVSRNGDLIEVMRIG